MDAVEYRRRGKMLAYQTHPMSAAFQEGRTALCGHHCQTTVRTRAHFYDISALECIKFWYNCDYIYYNSVVCNAPGGFLSIESQGGGRGGCLAGVVLWSKSLKESRDLLTVDVLERVYCEIARAAPVIFLAFLQSNPRGAGSRTAEWEVGVCGPHAGESSIGERHATHHPVCCKLRDSDCYKGPSTSTRNSNQLVSHSSLQQWHAS